MRGQCKGKLPCNVANRTTLAASCFCNKEAAIVFSNQAAHTRALFTFEGRLSSAVTISGTAVTYTVSTCSPSNGASVYKTRRCACRMSSIPWWPAFCRLHMSRQAVSVGRNADQAPHTHLGAYLPRPGTVMNIFKVNCSAHACIVLSLPFERCD